MPIKTLSFAAAVALTALSGTLLATQAQASESVSTLAVSPTVPPLPKTSITRRTG